MACIYGPMRSLWHTRDMDLYGLPVYPGEQTVRITTMGRAVVCIYGNRNICDIRIFGVRFTQLTVPCKRLFFAVNTIIMFYWNAIIRTITA